MAEGMDGIGPKKLKVEAGAAATPERGSAARAFDALSPGAARLYARMGEYGLTGEELNELIGTFNGMGGEQIREGAYADVPLADRELPPTEVRLANGFRVRVSRSLRGVYTLENPAA